MSCRSRKPDRKEFVGFRSLGQDGVQAIRAVRRTPGFSLFMAAVMDPHMLAREYWTVQSTVDRAVPARRFTLGIGAGAVLSVWSARLVASLLFGVEATDPLTIAGMALGLLAVAAAAGLPPESYDPATSVTVR